MSEHFARFWNAYNYKIGRKACERIWKRDKLDSIADQVIASIPAYDAHLRDEAWKKKKHPSTFLGGAHWEDEYPTPKPRTPRNAAELSAKQMMERQNGPIINGHANEGDRSGHDRSIGGAFLASIETIGNG